MRAQPIGLNDDAVHRLDRGRVGQRRPSGHLRQFAKELTGAVRDDKPPISRTVGLADFDLAARYDNQPGADLAGGEELVAGLKRAALAEAAHALDLERLEIGEHLIASLLGDRLGRRRHGVPTLDPCGEGSALYRAASCQAKYWPPLAVSVEPVIRPASSDAKNTTQRAISSGSPRRPMGICGKMFFCSTSCDIAFTMSVAI